MAGKRPRRVPTAEQQAMRIEQQRKRRKSGRLDWVCEHCAKAIPGRKQTAKFCPNHECFTSDEWRARENVRSVARKDSYRARHRPRLIVERRAARRDPERHIKKKLIRKIIWILKHIAKTLALRLSIEARLARPCVLCAEQITGSVRARYCSSTCSNRARTVRDRHIKAAYRRMVRLERPEQHARAMACIAAWARRNRAQCLEAGRRYARKFPERRRAKNNRWAKEHPERWAELRRNAHTTRRAKLAGAFGTFTEAEFQIIIKKQLYRCAICNERLGKNGAWHRDHIVPIAVGGCNFAFNIQGLCGHCNSVKNATDDAVEISLFDQLDAAS
jgi:hypothetical protein